MLVEEQSLCSLLSLPQLPLQAVIKCLSQEDKQSLAGTCRQLAAAVSAASPDTLLTVTPSTGWQGISKVLNTHTITCKTLRIEGRVAFQFADSHTFQSYSKIPQVLVNASPNNAFDILLGPEQVTGCSFPGVQQVQIHVHQDDNMAYTKAKIRPLRCLLPVNIASCLPDLEELEIKYEPGLLADSADLHPIPYCSSLRKLTCIASPRNGAPLQLPRKYHTAEDLRRQLPNIVSLTVMPWFMAQHAERQFGDCMERMLNAWGDQLIEMKLDKVPADLQRCTNLQCLTVQSESITPVVPLADFPSSVTSLTLNIHITESELQVVLQFPALRVFSASGFTKGLQQDWSQHPCTWQQLKLDALRIEDLAKLPLHSLTGEGCLNIATLLLPDPLLPDSLAAVERAARCVSQANIMIEGLVDWYCEAWDQHDVHRYEVDTKSAELLHAASVVVQPSDYYSHTHMPLYPKVETALFRWLSPKVRECHINHIGMEFDIWPGFWQSLQCCSHLDRLRIVSEAYCSPYQVSELFSTVVQQVAESLVAVTRRPVILAMLSFSWDDGCEEEFEMTASDLQLQIQQELPSTVSLKEFKWTDCDVVVSLEPVSQYTCTSSTPRRISCIENLWYWQRTPSVARQSD